VSRFALFCAFLLLPVEALSQECTEATAVDLPCSGVLLPRPWALECASCRDVQLPECRADLESVRELAALDLDSIRLELDAERLAHDETRRLLALAEKHAGPPMWFEHPAFWTAVGVAIGASVTAGIAGGVSK
jgi:hypothetical protein